MMLADRYDIAKFEAEIELAKRVQLSMLPKDLPRVPGLDVWGATRAAFHVGGDFYDFVERADSTLTLVVGDVSGKGMAAALLMAVTRRVIRTQTNFRSAPTPETILRYTNAELYADFTNSLMMATAFVGQYNTAQHVLTFANAGHSPVMYRPAAGPTQVLGAEGTALGVLLDTGARDQQIVFHPGDVLVVGTDGLNEARNGDDRMFGYYGLKQTVDATAHLPAHAIVAELYAAVDRYSLGDNLQDDQTLVVLKYDGV